MRNVLRPPLTFSDEERRIKDDFEGLVYAPVPYALERETRELLGEYAQSVLECPLCKYAAVSDAAMQHDE